MPAEMVKTGKRVAKDGETTITIGGQVYFKAKFTIDPSKKPAAIDYDMTEGPAKGKKLFRHLQAGRRHGHVLLCQPQARTGRRISPPRPAANGP